MGRPRDPRRRPRAAAHLPRRIARDAEPTVEPADGVGPLCVTLGPSVGPWRDSPARAILANARTGRVQLELQDDGTIRVIGMRGTAFEIARGTVAQLAPVVAGLFDVSDDA